MFGRKRRVIEDEEMEELMRYKQAATSRIYADLAVDIAEEIYKKVMNDANFDEKHKLQVFDAAVRVFCTIISAREEE